MTALTLLMRDEDQRKLLPEERLQWVERAARLERVIKLWQDDEIRGGYSGTLLGKSRNEFYAILAERRIARIKGSKEELQVSYLRFKAPKENGFGSTITTPCKS